MDGSGLCWIRSSLFVASLESMSTSFSLSSMPQCPGTKCMWTVLCSLSAAIWRGRSAVVCGTAFGFVGRLCSSLRHVSESLIICMYVLAGSRTRLLLCRLAWQLSRFRGLLYSL